MMRAEREPRGGGDRGGSDDSVTRAANRVVRWDRYRLAQCLAA